tara:strand:- start:2078 stop:4054 length:1977 start_codon:yes stop_codon:yes gene_type:complete
VAEDQSKAEQPLTESEQHTVHTPEQKWSNSFALKVAVQDFEAAEIYRTQNHDWRFREHFRLYEGWVDQKYWEGTRIPRSSVPVFLAFEQIESFMPNIISNIFADSPWFDVEPGELEDPKAAAEVQKQLLNKLAETGVREVFRRWIKSGLLHGNGIYELSWLEKQNSTTRAVPRWEPKTGFELVDGVPVPQPGFDRVVDIREFIEFENRPKLTNNLITDFYIDPNCPSPDPKEALYCATRHLLRVEEVDALRQNEEFSIPGKRKLIQMANDKPTTQGDQVEQSAELAREGSYNPWLDQTIDPGGKRLEVIRYWRDDRLVYVLNREKVAYNESNPYGFKPFYGNYYADIPGRFYAMGMCDVLEGEQQLEKSIINARIDELNLNIHRPMIKRRGITIPAYSLRSRPGQVLEAENPREDFVFPAMPNVTQQAYIEVDASSNRAQRITGGSNLAIIGGANPGGNSAARTATGVNAQTGAAFSRIQYLVQNAEDIGIEPMLADVLTLMQIFPPLGSADPGTQVIQNTGAKFKMRASARMLSRVAMQQNLPLLIQSMMNPAFMQQLAQTGKVPDFQELFDVILEITNYQKKGDFIRDLTEQEQQARGQPSSEDQIRQKMQTERIAGQKEITEIKLGAEAENEQDRAQTEIAKALLPSAIKGALGE